MHAIGTCCAFKVAIAARVAMNTFFFPVSVVADIFPTKQMAGLSFMQMTSGLAMSGRMLLTLSPYLVHAITAGRNCMRPEADDSELILIALISVSYTHLRARET